MKHLKRCLLGLGLAVLAILLGGNGMADPVAAAQPAGASLPPRISGNPSAKSSRAPRFVSIRIKRSGRALVAGETGILKLEARLGASQKSSGQTLAWDPSVTAPVTLWIASPGSSGIAFLDKAHPERPHQHILVHFTRPPDNLDQPLSAQVEYSITSRTKAGKHSFWLDIFAELKNPDGGLVHDAGVMRLPFEVDTHLRTKLLMLAVVAAAVFLFIVEWVRVDVVAIVMMVLLPELGLLNSSDTFRGLSSNAVVAIIGVMIISYGLNRAGLVHRIIQPILKFVSKSPSRLGGHLFGPDCRHLQRHAKHRSRCSLLCQRSARSPSKS